MMRREPAKHEDAGEVHGIGGDKCVAGGIGQLVNEQVERLSRLPPDEVMRAARVNGFDVVFGAQSGNQAGAIVERIGCLRHGAGAQPRNPHDN
jgi:hypothetical protein